MGTGVFVVPVTRVGGDHGCNRFQRLGLQPTNGQMSALDSHPLRQSPLNARAAQGNPHQPRQSDTAPQFKGLQRLLRHDNHTCPPATSSIVETRAHRKYQCSIDVR